MSIKKKSLSSVLFSKVRQRIFTLLFCHPDRSFFTNEIIRTTQSGTGAVQRELEILNATGLISMESIGNQKHYKANRNSPLFSELRNIVLKTFGLTDILQEELTPIISQIHVAFVYGSIAKQEDTANSDIDLMLISDTLTYADLFTLLENAYTKLNRPINPTLYSFTEWKRKIKANHHFLTQIIKQPKIFIIGTEDALTKLG